MRYFQPLAVIHMDSLVKRLFEGAIDGNHAVDELVNTLDLNPDSVLGKALTDLMSSVAVHDLLDYYIGFERHGTTIKVFFTREADKETVQQLMDDITTERDRRPGDERPFVSGKLYKSKLDVNDDEFRWIIELSYVGMNFDASDFADDVPIETDVEGDMEVQSSGGEETDSEEGEE